MATASLVLSFSGLIWIFYALCIVCDEHLVPAVEVFIKQFEVPEEVAAVTLVAFGSAAPELFLNSVSAVAQTSDLSLSAILGSGMIAFGLIPALCVLNSLRYETKFKIYPIIRECSFYMFGLTFFLFHMNDGQIETTEALIAISVYVFYVSMVVFAYWRDLRTKTVQRFTQTHPHLAQIINANPSITVQDIEALQAQHEAGLLSIEHVPLLNQDGQSEDIDSVDIIEDIQAVDPVNTDSNTYSRTLDYINKFMCAPIRFVCSRVFYELHPRHLPVEQDIVPLWKVCSVFAQSIFAISICASLIVSLSEVLVESLNIGSSTLGATLVALGSEIPDTISAMSLARNGYHDGALAGAIGSQVINISLGVGLPALFVCLSGNGF
eukprot:gene38157-46366_t